MLTILEIVKNTKSVFSHAIAGVLYYIVEVGEEKYQFPIDMNDRNDVGTTTFVAEYKSITLMRYINKAIKNEEFIKIK